LTHIARLTPLTHGTSTYNAATGETTGTGFYTDYSYSYDNTQLVGGARESKSSYHYSNGSQYDYDTVSQADGSYIQAWMAGDGSSGSYSADASGVMTGNSWALVDGNQGVRAGNNELLLGSIGTDYLYGNDGVALLAGGAGDDTIVTGTGQSIIAFNLGDGKDQLYANSGQNNTISLGGHFAFSDLALQKNGNDLILDVGASDSITFKDWYAGAQNIVNLQVIESAMSDFNPGSADVLRNSNVENFDFQQLVSAFDQAQAANPSLNAWGVTTHCWMRIWPVATRPH